MRHLVVAAALCGCSPGLPLYDKEMVDMIRTWEFEPYLDDGKPLDVCTSFIFSIDL